MNSIKQSPFLRICTLINEVVIIYTIAVYGRPYKGDCNFSGDGSTILIFHGGKDGDLLPLNLQER